MRYPSIGIAVVAVAFQAQADVGRLFGISGQAGPNAVLYEIDPLTGAATEYLTLNADGGFLMGLTSLGGELYATGLRDYPGAPDSPTLGRIDMTTGDIEFISDINGVLNAQGLASNETEGVFYTVDSSTLFSINTGGDLTAIGSTGGVDGRGMAYDDGAGVLYAVDLDDNLYTMDTGTGATSLIGEVGIPPTGFDWAGLAFDEFSGTLLLIDGVGENLWSLNTDTAEATLIGSNGVGGITGLAWVVPAPSSLALLLPLAVVGRRRR